MTALVLSAILSLYAPEYRDEHRERLEPFAADIAAAVERHGDMLPLRGPARLEAAALLLVAIARHESAFRAEVIDCRVRGDDGRSVTAWQLMRPWALGGLTVDQVCASPELAATRALVVLGIHAKRCRNGTPLAWVQGYGSGSCGRPAPVVVRRNGRKVVIDEDGARTRCRTWERLSREHGLVGVSCDVLSEIRRVD